MPWTCPSCRTAISLSELDAKPRPNVPYQCLVCQIELAFDPIANVLLEVPIRLDLTNAPKTNLYPEQPCESCGGMLVVPVIAGTAGFESPPGTHYVCLK